MGQTAAAIGGVAGGIIGDAVGLGVGAVQGNKVARAAGRQQRKQREAIDRYMVAQRQREEERIRREEQQQREAVRMAAPTEAELNTVEAIYNQRVQAEQQLAAQIQQEEKLLSEIDPVIMESAKQQHEIMKGKMAPILDPLRRKQELAEQKFEANMQRRLGSSWRTSTAGAQALMNFESKQAETMMDAQFGAMTSLRQTGATASVQRQQIKSQTQGLFSTAQQGVGAEFDARNALTTRKLNAFTSMKPDFGIKGMSQYEMASARLEGDEETMEILKAQNIAQTGRGAGKLFGKTSAAGGSLFGAG